MRATVRGQPQSSENRYSQSEDQTEGGEQKQNWYTEHRTFLLSVQRFTKHTFILWLESLEFWRSSILPLYKEGPKLKFIRKTRLTIYKTVS